MSDPFKDYNYASDQGIRTSGLVQLLKYFSIPALGMVGFFIYLILEMNASSRSNRVRKRRDVNSSAIPWHMHFHLKEALKGLEKEETLKRKEFDFKCQFMKPDMKILENYKAKKLDEFRKRGKTEKMSAFVAQFKPIKHPKSDGVFSKKEAGSIVWTPTDRALFYLMRKKTVHERKKLGEYTSHELLNDDLYR